MNDEEKMNNCIYCDPQHFVVYGKCYYCGNQRHARLIEFPSINREVQLKFLIKSIVEMSKK